MHRLMRLTMHRAISQDSSGTGSNPSTPGSAPSTAEVIQDEDQGQRQALWRESKGLAHTMSMDEISSSLEEPREKKFRNSTSDSDIASVTSQDDVIIPTRDVECRLVRTLNPRTKFDSHDAMVTGLTFKINGDLVVSDTANHKVKAIDVRNGGLKIECSVGSNQATLAAPSGVTVLKSGQILVTDAASSDLKLFTKDGRYLAKFGRDLDRPRDVTCLANGNVVVSDAGTNRIILFQNLSEKGVVDLTQDVENGGSLKLGQPVGVTVSQEGGKFSICDAKNNTILLVDGHGKLLNTYYQPKSGSQTGAVSGSVTGAQNGTGCFIQPGLGNPMGISQELHGNSILIADTDNNRIVRLDLHTMTLTRTVLTSNDLEGQQQKGHKGHKGQVQGHLDKPELVAAGPDGLIAVVDKDKSVVKIYKYMD